RCARPRRAWRRRRQRAAGSRTRAACPQDGRPPVSLPAMALEADVLLSGERALRQARARAALVVDARRDVVRRVRVEDARQRLDLPPPGPELELTAAVHRDPTPLADVDHLEQLLDA